MSESPKRSASPKERSQERHSEDKCNDRRSRSRDDKKDSSNFTQVYVAKLHRNTREKDLEDAFAKFGKIKELALKYAYAFIDFEEHEAAEQAIKEMHGKTFVNGEELVVEKSGRENWKLN